MCKIHIFLRIICLSRLTVSIEEVNTASSFTNLNEAVMMDERMVLWQGVSSGAATTCLILSEPPFLFQVNE